MPTVLKLHRIGTGIGKKKSIARATRNRMLNAIELTPTIHFFERFVARVQEKLKFADIAEQLKDQRSNVHYCSLHNDYRIVCKKYTFHLGANKELITVYLSNKKERKKREGLHDWKILSSRECMEYRSGKHIYLGI